MLWVVKRGCFLLIPVMVLLFGGSLVGCFSNSDPVSLTSPEGLPSPEGYDPQGDEAYKDMDGDGLYHHSTDCNVCHDVIGALNNLKFVKDTIVTPVSGTLPVVFVATEGKGSFADGDGVYDGICEVCHVGTSHHRNNASGDHGHYVGTSCVGCHTHANEFHPGSAPDHNQTVDRTGPACVGCHTSTALVDPNDNRVHNDCNTCHDQSWDLVTGAVTGGGDCIVCHGGPSSLMVYHNGWNQRHYYAGGYLACDQVMATSCAGCHLPPLVSEDYPGYENYLVAVKYAVGDIHWGGSCNACHIPDNSGLRSPGVLGGGLCTDCHVDIAQDPTHGQ